MFEKDDLVGTFLMKTSMRRKGLWDKKDMTHFFFSDPDISECRGVLWLHFFRVLGALAYMFI